MYTVKVPLALDRRSRRFSQPKRKDGAGSRDAESDPKSAPSAAPVALDAVTLITELVSRILAERGGAGGVGSHAVNGITAAAPVHVLKSVLKPFEAKWTGRKRYDVRKSDRGFAEGHGVIFLEFELGTSTGWYGGRALLGRICHVTGPEAYGIPPGLCVFGFEVLRHVYCRRVERRARVTRK